MASLILNPKCVHEMRKQILLEFVTADEFEILLKEEKEQPQ